MDGREHHVFILVTAIVPLLGVVAAMVLLWNQAVTTPDLVAFLVMYLVTGVGVSTGYHRLLAHRSFQTSRPVKLFLTVGGAMAGQGPPLIWAAHHRRHHRVADKPGDPHSPYADLQPGIRGALKGLWHSHLGWLFDRELTSDPMRYCPDLARDRDIRLISKHFIPIVVAGLLLPGLIGLAWTGTLTGFLTAVLWGGIVRFFVNNHATYAVNSVGHYFGSRRFATADESRNVFWLALPSFGEAWHNNHHAFPRSFRHGMRWYELDPSAIVIGTLERLGLARNVMRIDPERMALKAEGMARAGGGRQAPAHAPQRPLAEQDADQLAAVGVTDVE
ncbi:MAG: acyl-CoA desaturase [Mycobacteriales bacterium]